MKTESYHKKEEHIISPQTTKIKERDGNIFKNVKSSENEEILFMEQAVSMKIASNTVAINDICFYNAILKI